MESNATRVAHGSRVTNLRPPHFVTPRALEGEWRQVLPQPSQVDGRIVRAVSSFRGRDERGPEAKDGSGAHDLLLVEAIL